MVNCVSLFCFYYLFLPQKISKDFFLEDTQKNLFIWGKRGFYPTFCRILAVFPYTLLFCTYCPILPRFCASMVKYYKRADCTFAVGSLLLVYSIRFDSV